MTEGFLPFHCGFRNLRTQRPAYPYIPITSTLIIATDHVMSGGS